eukprot:CAMPEP_0114422556 /NCGR_PEP_ID=MMETSP0103-20121206/5672_1 /TAXON_ID=37642 ORGANISM="Paraphysomonas imperforata, Strain PA2" /NCGR_SAMPLE_ID=MMETSP0103 /ASSEMBLY_ACC=CAM_ASM_000201 /LENGTH=521 /DNA_ID=CAMNT_0001591147 /DNA_START=49 /DNA_END=1614 /DNA_ORIENTATION=+
MVVLSAAICTKTGKALISRQFVDMTRIRIEGLLASFPKLLGSDSKQHTFVETESVRYVYQPMESLFLLLITNKASNIVEDLDTLRLLSKVVPDIAGTANNLSEDKVTDKCFELIFAFDEVITAGGYRENLNLQQIRTNLEMDSHEEKLHNMIKISKMDHAREQMKDAAKVIREKNRDIGRQGIGGGSGPMDDSSYESQRPVSNKNDMMDAYKDSKPSFTPTPAARAAAAPKKGMSLTSKSSKNKSLEDALVLEDKLAPIISTSVKSAPVADVEAPQAIQHPIMLVINEKVYARITRDGVVESNEVKGSLTLTAASEEAGLCSVQMKTDRNADKFTFTTHPKVNKPMYEKSGLLQLKDINKGFPSARPVGILKWSYSSASEDLIPLKINCWPEEESRGQMNVSIEYELEQSDLTLHDVSIRIPLGTTEGVNIVSMDGSYKHHSSQGELEWQLPLVDSSNASGSLEFTIAQKDTDAFFPISVGFSSQQLFCGIEVLKVASADGANPIQYGISQLMSAEEYTIE